MSSKCIGPVSWQNEDGGVDGFHPAAAGFGIRGLQASERARAKARVMALRCELDDGEWTQAMVTMMEEDCRLLMQDLGIH